MASADSKMRQIILHSLARYYPQPCGGIQINLSELIPQLAKLGYESAIIVPDNCRETSVTTWLGTKVYRYFSQDLVEFARLLSLSKATIYHQHHFEANCGLEQLAIAKAKRLKVYLTLHYSLPLCEQLLLEEYAKGECDGEIRIDRCSKCNSSLMRKLPRWSINQLSKLPGSALSSLPEPFAKHLGLPRRIHQRIANLTQLIACIDCLILPCEWLYRLLLINAIVATKLRLIRCGTGLLPRTPLQTHLRQKLRIGYFGRAELAKGVDRLIAAVKPLTGVELHLRLIIQSADEASRISQQIGDAQQITMLQPANRAIIADALQSYDLIAIPSLWHETGPLLALEAHSQGVPILASKLGGLIELVEDQVNGILLPPYAIAQWREAIVNLRDQREVLQRLAKGITPVRRIDAQARELAQVYKANEK